jgi:hypothetical protein
MKELPKGLSTKGEALEEINDKTTTFFKGLCSETLMNILIFY